MVDIDWLKDHVEVPEDLTYEQLARDLVKVGLEEEEIHASQVTGPIVVGYVVDATPEPQKNGKTINWCHVDVGDEYNEVDENGNKAPRGIVCGAPNMKAGEKVVVTLPGAVLPGDFRIEPRKTYGHISNGMCAARVRLHPRRIRGPEARRRRDAPAASGPAVAGDQHHAGPRLCALVPWRVPRIPPFHRRRLR